MSTAAFNRMAVVLLVLAGHASAALAQSAASAVERQHADALASFRQARFPDAYGRFIRLADAGHAPSAEVALWMYLNGPTLFNPDWDSTQDQLTAWARLAHQPTPTLVGRSYPQTGALIVGRTR
jgi:hypothetical protein